MGKGYFNEEEQMRFGERTVISRRQPQRGPSGGHCGSKRKKAGSSAVIAREVESFLQPTSAEDSSNQKELKKDFYGDPTPTHAQEALLGQVSFSEIY